MRSVAVMILIGCLSSACAIGMESREFKPATAPAGIRAHVQTTTGQLTGELIEVREAAIVLLTEEGEATAPGGRPRRLRLVPFTAISRADFEQRGSDVRLSDGQPPSPRARERLRLLSRFPYGMSPAVERELLKAYGQSAFDGVDR